MVTKTFEIRDRLTFIPVLATKLEPSCEADRYLLARAGYGLAPKDQGRYVFLARIAGGIGKATCDPFEWGGRTMPVAHQHIIEHFDELTSGSVVDVEFILGEAAQPKVSEAASEPLTGT